MRLSVIFCWRRDDDGAARRTLVVWERLCPAKVAKVWRGSARTDAVQRRVSPTWSPIVVGVVAVAVDYYLIDCRGKHLPDVI